MKRKAVRRLICYQERPDLVVVESGGFESCDDKYFRFYNGCTEVIVPLENLENIFNDHGDHTENVWNKRYGNAIPIVR